MAPGGRGSVAPKSGQDLRRRIPPGPPERTPEEWAELWAWDMQASILAGRGVLPSLRESRPEPQGPTTTEALRVACTASRGGEAHLARLASESKRFLAWLVANHPDATEWAKITPGLLGAYCRHLQDPKGAALAYDSARLALEPVRRASKYWNLEDPSRFRNVFALAAAKPTRGEPKQPPALDAKTLAQLLDWLKIHRKGLYPLAVLQSLAGFRVLEAVHIRPADIDPAAGTIRIAKTATHTPKNRASYRVVPVLPEVMAAVLDYWRRLRIQPASEAPLFVNDAGRPWTLAAIKQAWLRAVGAARDGAEETPAVRGHKARPARAPLPLPVGFTAHHCRSTFATLARAAGADRSTLKRYIGHAAGDILGQHYEAVTTAVFLEQVVSKVAVSLARDWQPPLEGGAKSVENKSFGMG